MALNVALTPGSYTEVEIDFGSTPVYSKIITVTDATVSGSSRVIVKALAEDATDTKKDEWQFDVIQMVPEVGTGEFYLHCLAVPGPVMGKRKIIYSVT